jgi:hypothetical protein
MDIEVLAMELDARLRPLGGTTACFDERTIAIQLHGLRGIVLRTTEGRFFLKAGTEWGDEDKITVDSAEEVLEKVVGLFQEFWIRRGLKG